MIILCCFSIELSWTLEALYKIPCKFNGGKLLSTCRNRLRGVGRKTPCSEQQYAAFATTLAPLSKTVTC